MQTFLLLLVEDLSAVLFVARMARNRTRIVLPFGRVPFVESLVTA
jgi:hypothetical protein